MEPEEGFEAYDTLACCETCNTVRPVACEPGQVLQQCSETMPMYGSFAHGMEFYILVQLLAAKAIQLDATKKNGCR